MSVSQINIDGINLGDIGEIVYPALKVVPMGWSWAMWIAQRIHQFQAAIALNVPVSQVLADGRPPPCLQGGTPLLIPYADNLNVCGIDKESVQHAKEVVVEHLRKLNFRVHEEQDASPVVQALGFEINGKLGLVSPIARKRDRLRLVLLWLSSRPRVSGAAIERVIGHCIHMFMLRREFLSVFRSMYDFKMAHYKHPYRLWRSAAQECKWAAALLLVCHSDMRKPWCPVATVSDACLSGTAVASLHSTAAIVSEIGQCREMWRFKTREPLNRARDCVLALDPFKDVETVKPGNHEPVDRFQLNLDFQHVPEKFACSSEWQTQFACRMSFPEHITILEGRATLQAMRHKLRSSKYFGYKHLHCGDNLGMVLSYDRGRAKSVPLLICCRKAAALCVAGDCVFTHRWLPSEWNAADGPSRQWESVRNEEASKRHQKRVTQGLCYPKSTQKQRQAEIGELVRRTFGLAQAVHSTSESEGDSHQEGAARCTSRQGRRDQGSQEATDDDSECHSQAGVSSNAVGSSCCGSSHRGGVQLQTPTLSTVLPDPEVEASKCERVGRSFAPLSQPIVHGGMDTRRRRQVSGRRVRLGPRLAKRRAESLQTCPPGLEKPGSRHNSSSSGLATDCLDRADHDRDELLRGGHCSSPDVCHLRSPQRDLLASKERFGLQCQFGARVVSQLAPSRGVRNLQGRRKQRDPSAQLAGSTLAGSCAQLPHTGSRRAADPVKLQHGDSCMEQCPASTQIGQAQECPVPTTSLRGQLGQVQKLQGHPGSEAPRPLGVGSQSPAIRTARFGGPAVRRSSGKTQAACPSSSGAPPQHGPWKMRPVRPTFLKPMLELFSGCAALSQAFLAEGFPVEAWDIEYNSGCNLLLKDNLQDVISRILVRMYSNHGVPK